MGIDNCYYLGPYINVWVPKVHRKLSISTCTKRDCTCHGRFRSNEKFCSVCGSPIGLEEIEQMVNMNLSDLFKEELGNEDIFSTHYWDEDEHVTVLPNIRGQGGIRIHNSGEYTLPDISKDNFVHPDWGRLITTLTKLEMKFEQKVGFIFYQY